MKMKKETPINTPESRQAYANQCRDFYDCSDCIYPNLEVELRLQYIASRHLTEALQITDRLLEAIRSGADRFTQDEIMRFEKYLCNEDGYTKSVEYMLSKKFHYYDMSRKKHRSKVYAALDYGWQARIAYERCRHPDMRSLYYRLTHDALVSTMGRVNNCLETGAKIPGALIIRLKSLATEQLEKADYFNYQTIPRDITTTGA